MVHKAKNTSNQSLKLEKISINIIFLLFLFQVLTVSAIADTISNSAMEANVVVKKNGRVFLIHQTSNDMKFLDPPKPENKIQSFMEDELIIKNRIKNLSLSKTKDDKMSLIKNREYNKGVPIRKVLFLK